MSTQYIKFRRQNFKEKTPGKLLNRKNINKQRASPQSLNRKRPKNRISRKNRSTEKNHLRMLFTEIIGICEEGNP
ncbi:hypothetical protein ACHQM5_025061 [Ranunculus cassubicifolius]